MDPRADVLIVVPGIALLRAYYRLANQPHIQESSNLRDGRLATAMGLPREELIGHAPVALGVHAVRQLGGDQERVTA